ncbi:methyltransferase [Streptomyces sp. HF10]|uniref:methyltransferase n=1 Tax=Streptomyces sp. HF10 TaxID=2692233 RepID=UPI00131994DD|nr:methyltransferase [Streptomyces sp. HF10]QHC28698.1 methyltransferase domain-containing protein [Streptomyces sp. HF10]
MTPHAEVRGPGEILQLTMAFYGSRALISAVELDLFTLLAEKPLDINELCDRAGMHPRGARDFLDALVALGLLEREDDGRYGNSPAAARHLDRREPGYVGGYTRLADTKLFPVWARLTDALRTGEKQVPSQGSFFGGYADPEAARGFLGAMDAVNTGVGHALAEALDWKEHSSFVDLGGARGNLAARLHQAHPHLHATCFDLPEMEQFFREHMRSLDLTDQVRFVAGDFFEDALPKADVFVVGHILHFFGLRERLDLLTRIHRALTPGGVVLVYDRMIDDDRRSAALSLLGSLNMLLTSDEGREYTPAECARWLSGSGFTDIRTTAVSGPDTLAIGRKPR